VTALAGQQVSIKRGCELVGLPRSTYYRISRGYQHYQPVAVPVPHKDRDQPAALTEDERRQILDLLDRDEYEDLSVQQTYWRCLDAGVIGCSQRSFYRVAAAHRLVGDRRRTRSGGHARQPPSAAATRPNQLWSWDVTELSGPGLERYKLMLIIDVYSRYPVGWRIEYTESKAFAVNLFSAALSRHGHPDVVHSDNGAVMRSHELVDHLTIQGVVTSFSRPRVSDDNPFSESMFKTIKYDLDCPERFDNIDHARAWTAAFLNRYAHQHRHSGLAHHTPATVFDGSWQTIRDHRQATLTAYHHQHPNRFRKPPVAATIQPTGINHLSQTG
jgi:transposase InsO family protein